MKFRSLRMHLRCSSVEQVVGVVEFVQGQAPPVQVLQETVPVPQTQCSASVLDSPAVQKSAEFPHSSWTRLLMCPWLCNVWRRWSRRCRNCGGTAVAVCRESRDTSSLWRKSRSPRSKRLRRRQRYHACGSLTRFCTFHECHRDSFPTIQKEQKTGEAPHEQFIGHVVRGVYVEMWRQVLVIQKVQKKKQVAEMLPTRSVTFQWSRRDKSVQSRRRR